MMKHLDSNDENILMFIELLSWLTVNKHLRPGSVKERSLYLATFYYAFHYLSLILEVFDPVEVLQIVDRLEPKTDPDLVIPLKEFINKNYLSN